MVVAVLTRVVAVLTRVVAVLTTVVAVLTCRRFCCHRSGLVAVMSGTPLFKSVYHVIHLFSVPCLCLLHICPGIEINAM